MFPAYLLNDPGFWLFCLLYVIAVAVTVELVLIPHRRIAKKPVIEGLMPAAVVLLFTYLIVEQFFHQAEHITQMYQFQFLGIPARDAHGFVWFFDDEWNHFTFNGLYLTGLCVVFYFLYRAMRQARIPRTLPYIGLMVAFLIIEGWHMVEHTYRIIHHVQGLCDQCEGILDPLTGINRLLIHFWFNYIALLLPAAMYVWFGLPRMLWTLIPRVRKLARA